MTASDLEPILAELRALGQRLDRLERAVGARTGGRIEPEALYRVQDAALLVGLHPDTLRKRLQVGAIRGSRRAGDWRVKGAELLKLA